MERAAPPPRPRPPVDSSPALPIADNGSHGDTLYTANITSLRDTLASTNFSSGEPRRGRTCWRRLLAPPSHPPTVALRESPLCRCLQPGTTAFPTASAGATISWAARLTSWSTTHTAAPPPVPAASAEASAARLPVHPGCTPWLYTLAVCLRSGDLGLQDWQAGAAEVFHAATRGRRNAPMRSKLNTAGVNMAAGQGTGDEAWGRPKVAAQKINSTT